MEENIEKTPEISVNLESEIPAPVIFKQCKKCGEEYDLSNFRTNNKNKDKKHSFCIPCHNLYEKNRYLAQKNKRIKNVRKWQNNNKEKVESYKKQWKARHSVIPAILENPPTIIETRDSEIPGTIKDS